MGEACPCILVTVAGYLVATVQPSANAAVRRGSPRRGTERPYSSAACQRPSTSGAAHAPRFDISDLTR